MLARLAVTVALLGTAPASVAGAGIPDPADALRAIRSTALAPERAVAVEGVTLNLGMARLEIRDAVLVPAVSGDGEVREMVLLGEARVVLRPPDRVEEQQLEIFTGAEVLDERVEEAVLVIAQDAAAGHLLARPAVELDAARAARAGEVLREWLDGTVRRAMDVETALLGDALGDPLFGDYFAGRFRGRELGEFFYLFEPVADEQVTLGRFVPVELTRRERRRAERRIAKHQRRGRLIGLELDDLGEWQTWVSASRRSPGGEPAPGGWPFDILHHELEVEVARGSLDLTARARLHLEALGAGPRLVVLELNPDLAVDAVRADGEELFFHRSAENLAAVLPAPVAPGDGLVLEVDYGGSLVDEARRARALRDTVAWSPRGPIGDRATYDVTFRWPRKLDLLASGTRIDGGVEGDTAWERRRVTQPVSFISFEVGRFERLEGEAAGVRIVAAFDPTGERAAREEARERILEAAEGAVEYFSEIFGPYPFGDDLVLATAPRAFSQASPGFITLSAAAMADDYLTRLLFGSLDDRRVVVAHEVAHQWWGHLVGWEDYRSQWLSEAMANYAALLYARHRLGHQRLSLTTGWQSSLLARTDDGRSYESLGPVVMGMRLLSSHGGGAYEAVVYKKGAVVLSMLERLFGEETFLQVLRAILRAVPHRSLTTAEFLHLVERSTDVDLSAFAEQFVYGTGLPEVYYEYRFEEIGESRWRVVGSAEQHPPYRYEVRLARRDDGGFDVARERIDELDVAGSLLVVPIQIAVYDPAKEEAEAVEAKGEGGSEKATGERDPERTGNSVLVFHALLQGATTRLAIEIEHEPKQLWLDAGKQVFGRFRDARRRPKRTLYSRAVGRIAARDWERAEAMLREALDAPVRDGPLDDERDAEENAETAARLDAHIHYQLARLHLDRGNTASAQEELATAHELMGRRDRPAWTTTLDARLALHKRDPETAFDLLRKAVLKRERLDSREALLLLAIAAHETGRRDELEEAAERLEERGVDVAPLLAAKG